MVRTSSDPVAVQPQSAMSLSARDWQQLSAVQLLTQLSTALNHVQVSFTERTRSNEAAYVPTESASLPNAVARQGHTEPCLSKA
jgi:hypothetical protein